MGVVAIAVKTEKAKGGHSCRMSFRTGLLLPIELLLVPLFDPCLYEVFLEVSWLFLFCFACFFVFFACSLACLVICFMGSEQYGKDAL